MDLSHFKKPFIQTDYSITAQVHYRSYTDYGSLQLRLVGTDQWGFECESEIDIPPEFGLKPFWRGRTVRVTMTPDNNGCNFKVEFPRASPMEVRRGR